MGTGDRDRTRIDKPKRDQRTKLGVGERAAAPPELIGTVVLDRYLVEAELGSGAMGTVYRAKHVKLGRLVALKVMHHHLVHEPMLLERFYREAKSAGRLQHPNVAAVIDVAETPDHKQVMVLELVEGQSLTELIDAGLTQARTVGIVKQLLLGLEHAHAMGLVHRDLKPDNVIVSQTADGADVPRIVDFGIAVLNSPDETLDRLTGTGMIIGTPLYMAPEQARAEEVDHRADLYALGVILYEMLSGMSPFEGTAMEVAVAKMDRDPTPIWVRAPQIDVDRVLAAFMQKLMARKAAARFATARVAHDLLALFETDRLAAATELGVIDVARALEMVSLPKPE